jgi:hypothetical protein
MKTFLTLFFNHWKKIALIALLTAIAATAFGIVYNRNSVSATIFINIGAIQDNAFGNTENPYDALQAADQFTESVMGWFKNPQLLETIRTQSGEQVDFSVRKQEKQNLLITYKTTSLESAKGIADVTRNNLEKTITVYNGRNSSNFTMPSFDTSLKESHLPLVLFALFGLVAGCFIGYFLALFWDILIKEYSLYRR